MTGGLAPINPFQLAGWGPLCPWKHPEHRDCYVDVDHTREQYDEFTRRMTGLATLMEYGQLVLVTGDSGCGKTALVNWCADWVAETLREGGERPATRCEIVDLTSSLAGRLELPVDERMSIVCDRLFGDLRRRGAMRPDALADLAPDRDRPDRIYPDLSDALHEDVALVILLPTPRELKNEVIRYATYISPRVLFLVESAFLDEEDVADIAEALKDGVEPVTLRVGPLEPGDVWRFVNARQQRAEEMGRYPRMDESSAKAVERLLLSVAQLERVLIRTYETRRHSALEYDKGCAVTADDIRQQFPKLVGADHERP